MDRFAGATCVSRRIAILSQAGCDRQQVFLLTLQGSDRAAARASVREFLAQLPHEIIETPTGPQFADSGHHISISYAGDKALIGISHDGRIGVDIVSVEPIAESAAISRLYLPVSARRYAGDEEFAARWASLEACCKALGLPLAEIDSSREAAYATCSLPACEQIPGYRIALAVAPVFG